MATKPEQPKDIEIVSVRNKRDCIEINWKEGADDCSRTFHDNPLPSFLKAVDGLTEHVITLCEFPASYAKGITATGITISEKGDCVKALITAVKKLKRNGRVLPIPTPLLTMYEDPENKGADHMSDAEAAAIEKMMKETKRYLAGERAQGQIVFVTPDSETKPKGTADNTTPFPTMAEPQSAAAK